MGGGDAGEHFCFESAFVVDAEGVDYSFFYFFFAAHSVSLDGGDCWRGTSFEEGHPAYPFTTITQTTDPLDIVRTGICCWEEIPYCVGIFPKVREGLGGEERDFGIQRVFGGNFVAERDRGLVGSFGAGHAL